MIYGYARVSTKGQAKDGNSLEAQETALREAGATEVYADAFTGTKAHRPQLDNLMEVLQPGDKLVVTKLDRVARSTIQGIELIQGGSQRASEKCHLPPSPSLPMENSGEFPTGKFTPISPLAFLPILGREK